LTALKGDKTMSELLTQFDVHPNQIKQWKDQLLVVRFRHLAPIARCPRPNVGIARTTRNDKVLVAFLNVTFVRQACGIEDTNVTFTPLDGVTSVFDDKSKAPKAR
jgi:hypothetical protein